MTRRAPRVAIPALAFALAGAACATTRPPAAGARAPSGPPASSVAAAAGASSATTSAPATVAENPAGKNAPTPGSFQALQAREASGLTAHVLDFSGGKLTGEVESAAAPVIKREAALWAITVPIGSQAPITCFLYDNPIDGAASLLRLVRMAQNGGAGAGGIAIQSITPTEVGVIAETAYIMATLSYTKPSPQGLLGGQVKMMVRPDADAPLVCLHDEVGYGATFKRVTQRLARSLAPKAPGAPPVEFVEIQIARVGDLPVGFERRTIATDLHGVKVDQTTTCMLFPRGPQELAGVDRVVTERSDVAGRLIELDSVEVAGAGVGSQIKVTRQDAGHEYQLGGTQAGAALAGHFKSKEKDGLPSSLLVASRLRALLLAGKAAELKVEEYHADLAPQPLEVTYRWKGQGRAVTLTLGQLEAIGRLDERGMVEQSSLPIGRGGLSQERVLMRGTP